MATLDFITLFKDRGAARGINDLAKNFEKAASSATDLETATKRLAISESKAADAAGQVRVAEARLDAVRKNAKATSVQRLQAEENLARAQRRLITSQNDVKVSSEKVAAAQKHVKLSLQQSAEQATQTDSRMRRAVGGLRTFGTAGVNATGRVVGGFKAVGVGAAGVAVGILAAVAAPVTFGLKTAAAMENAEIAFTTMLGSARKAKAFLGELQQFAASTPFEFPELQQAASSLISVGVNAKNVIPIMTTLGNVTSGMGTGSEGVQRATVALQQMQSAGRITAEDLNQLRDAGIPLKVLFKAMGEELGVSSAKLFEMSRNGKLGKQELEALMTVLQSGKGFDRFNGLMDKQSRSLNGMLSTLKDTFGQGMAKALEGAIPFIKEGIKGLTGALGNFFEYTQTHQEAMVAGFISAGDAVFALAEAFLQLNKTGLRAMGDLSFALANLLDGLKYLGGPFAGDMAKSADSLREFGAGAHRAADDIDSKLIPTIRDAHDKWTAFGKDRRTEAAMRDGNARIQKALNNTKDAIKQNGRTLDLHSEKGAANRRALRNLAEENVKYIGRLRENNASTKRLDRATEDARQTFIKTAVRMGASRQQANRLADSFGLLNRRIRTLSDKKVDIKFATNAKGVYKTFKGFAVNLTSPSSVGRLASGGMVSGPGTPTSDSIPTMLSNGEFVVNAAAVKRHRQLLEAINKDKVPEMAGGGYVHVNPGKFPSAAMDVPKGANAFATAFAKATSKRLGEGLAKVFKSMDFGGPGGGITGAAGGRVHYKGGTFTKLFARNLELVERAAHTSMRIFQGGFRPATSYSGTSHRGDAVDFQVNYGLGRAFRKYVGAAGDRTGLGHWSPHIHAVPSPRTGRAGGSAIWQYKDYVRRGGARQSMRSPWGLSTGGLVTRPSDIRAGEFGPERMLSVPQTRSFDRLVRVMDRSGGAANTYITVNAPHYVGDKNDLVKALVDLKRQSRLSVVLR